VQTHSLPRDYSLLGADALRAQQNGLASAQWYSPMLARKQLKALMQRKNGPAIRDTAVWVAALAITGRLGIYCWGSWPAIIAFACYGVLYGSASDSRWHECGHGTAFKTRWMNDVLYQVACFMILREPTVWRWSHARHHTDTIIVGRDPEINVRRPPDFLGMALNLFGLKNGFAAFRSILLHAAGGLSEEEKSFIPEMEQHKVHAVARIYLAIFTAVIASCFALHSILPAMLIGLPTFYGAWLQVIFGITQHAGLAEDVLDHRLNSRTIMMNPVFRFIYWNMNYHQEHHMFPMVPYHALPALHEAIRSQCPATYPSLLAAFREIIPALLRQAKEPTYHVERSLPSGALAQAPQNGAQSGASSGAQDGAMNPVAA
jgi:fatty acid desaturase